MPDVLEKTVGQDGQVCIRRSTTQVPSLSDRSATFWIQKTAMNKIILSIDWFLTWLQLKKEVVRLGNIEASISNVQKDLDSCKMRVTEDEAFLYHLVTRHASSLRRVQALQDKMDVLKIQKMGI